jgi:hypothetical protein
MNKKETTAQNLNLPDNPPAIVQPAPEFEQKSDLNQESLEISMAAVANLFADGQIELDENGNLTGASLQNIKSYLKSLF